MKHIRGIQDPLLWGVLWLTQHCAPRDMHAWYRYSDIDTAGLSTAEAVLRKLAQRFVTQIWALVYVLARQGKFDEMRFLFDLQYYDAADDEMHTVFFPLETNSSHHGVVTSMYFKTFGQIDPVCVHSGRADAAGFLFERMATHSPAKPPHVRYQMHQLAVARCARCDDVELLEVMIQLSEAHPTLKALAFPLDYDNNAILRTAVKHNSMRVVRCLLRLGSKHGVDAWAQRGHIIATAVRGGSVDFLHEVLTALGGGCGWPSRGAVRDNDQDAAMAHGPRADNLRWQRGSHGNSVRARGPAVRWPRPQSGGCWAAGGFEGTSARSAWQGCVAGGGVAPWAEDDGTVPCSGEKM